MPFNPFNTSPFNRIASRAEEYAESYAMTEDLLLTVVVKVKYNASYKMSSAMSGSFNLIYTYGETYDMQESLSADMTAYPEMTSSYEMQEELTGYAAMLIPAIYKMEESLTGDLYCTVLVIPTYYMYGPLTAIFSSIQTEEITMRFDGLSIPPDGIIVVDSETFTALLNNENIIDKYSGEWIFLDPKLTGLYITSDTGGDLETRIFYREEFL